VARAIPPETAIGEAARLRTAMMLDDVEKEMV